MRNLIWLLLLLPVNVSAKAPECPAYSTKKECLQSVDDNFNKLFEFLNEEEGDFKKKLIQAATDIKHYETLACQKTCLN